VAAPEERPAPEILVVFNPHAGGAHRARLQKLISKHFADRELVLLESPGAGGLRAALAPWLARGIRLVIAAGGDGTASDVAGALVGTDVPMGLLPLGTGNVLARELGLPMRSEEASRLLAAYSSVRRLDVMEVEGRTFMLGVSVGLSARTMHGTREKAKRRFGRSAYLWPLLRNLFAPPDYDFAVQVDGRLEQVRANEVIVVSAGIVGYKPLRWGPEIQPDDGHLDICFVQARTLLDFLDVFRRLVSSRPRRDRRLNCQEVHASVLIESPVGLTVQGDGDVIGETPVEIRLRPAALSVVVPER
jgi:diacylglycerol kinase family enzyme